MIRIIIGVGLLWFSLPTQAQSTLLNEGNYGLHIQNTYLVADSTHLIFRSPMQNTFAQLKITGDKDINLEANGNTFSTVEITKTPFTKVIMSKSLDEVVIEDELKFSNIDNHIVVNTATIELLMNGVVTGNNNRNYCITNDVGYLKKSPVGMTAFEFPVGYDVNTYNPVILSEMQSPDSYRVRCLEHVLMQGGTGTPIANEVVDASWEILEDTPGEMDLGIIGFWADTDELPSFDRFKCGVSRWNGTSWDLQLPNVAPAGGTNPYERERFGVMEDGFFAVGGAILAESGGTVDLKVLLQGAYVGAGEHQDDLRFGGYLPLGEPYTGLGFTQAGFGGGETTENSVFATTGSDAIVDWLLLEIFDTATPAQLVATQAVLLQKDGDVVAMDGESIVSIPGLPDGNYTIAIYHRNHIPVKIAVPVFLSEAPTVIDLMTDPSALIGEVNAVADLGDGFYALISGDFDGNGQVQNTDGNGMILQLGTPGYLSGDTDLNGQIQNIDLQLKLTPNLGRGQQF